MKKIIFAILLVLVIVGGLAGTKFLQIKKLTSQSFAQPPESVSAVSATQEKWQDTLSAIGSISAVQGVTVNPEIAGPVREILFESGAIVTKGDVLVRLDTTTEEAQLRSLDAQLDWDRINLARITALRTNNMVSQSDLDFADAGLKQHTADADALRATIAKKTIRAPFAGQLGIRMVNLGQYLEAGKAIVSLQALKPVYANFSLPQQELARIKEGMKVRVTTDAYAGTEFEGKLTAINPDLDASTRSVSLQATFDNADHALRPGMFARIEVLLPEEQDVLVIPATSVLSEPFGDSVFVLESKPGKDGKEELTVRQQFIRSGRARGDFIAVESGLKSGDRIVSSGIFKLRNGMSVVESRIQTPKNEVAPHPIEG